MLQRSTTPHVNNKYDNNGQLRKTIVVDWRKAKLDKCRNLLTQMDIELMNIHPDFDRLTLIADEINVQLSEGFMR